MAIYDQNLEYEKLRLAKQGEFNSALQAIGQFMNQRKELAQQAPLQQAQTGYYNAQAGKLNQAQLAYQNYMNGMGGQPQGVMKTYKDPMGNTFVTKQFMDYQSKLDKKRSKNITDRGKSLHDYKANNPILDQDTKGAVSAYEYSVPRLQRVSEALGQISEDDFSNIVKQIQVGANNDLIVPDGSPIEDLVGAINDIRLTGFGLGGKNFTENEAKIVFGRLNPVGKSRARYQRDINSLPDFFQSKIKTGLGGRSNAESVLGTENPMAEGSDLASSAAAILAKRRNKK